MQHALADGIDTDGITALVYGLFALLGLYIVFMVARVIVEIGVDAAKAARDQVRAKFWREAGKLGTFLSFALLLLAYGLYWTRQERTLGQALLDLGRERLAQILPPAVITQAILLAVFWIAFCLLAGVRRTVVLGPFKAFLGAAVLFGLLSLTSFIPFWATGADKEAMKLVGALGALAVMIGVPLMALRVKSAQERGRPFPKAVGWVALAALTTMFSIGISAVYVHADATPTGAELFHLDLVIAVLLTLVVLYQFRRLAGEADVPPTLPHLIDFALALSAAAIAVIAVPGAQVTLGPVPPVVVALAPALIVAGMIWTVHLRPSKLRGTPRPWPSLATAVGGGVAMAPLKLALAAPIAALAGLLPF